MSGRSSEACEVTSQLVTSPHLRKQKRPRTQPLLPLEMWERVLLNLTRESLLWGATEVARDLCNVSATCSVLYAAAQPVRQACCHTGGK